MGSLPHTVGIRRGPPEAAPSEKQEMMISNPFRGNQPGKNGQKIGIMITLTMKQITHSGTPTFT